jgi:hypothetical protein
MRSGDPAARPLREVSRPYRIQLVLGSLTTIELVSLPAIALRSRCNHAVITQRKSRSRPLVRDYFSRIFTGTFRLSRPLLPDRSWTISQFHHVFAPRHVCQKRKVYSSLFASLGRTCFMFLYHTLDAINLL